MRPMADPGETKRQHPERDDKRKYMEPPVTQNCYAGEVRRTHSTADARTLSRSWPRDECEPVSNDR